MSEYHIGTSGYSYPHWGPSTNNLVSNFYPTKNSGHKWLLHYKDNLLDSHNNKLVSSVEINSTRYQKLKPSTCASYRQIRGMSFTLKCPTYITHSKKMNDFEEWWLEFYPNIQALGDSFGCLLFQFPPKFKYTEKNMNKLLEAGEVLSDYDVRCAFEFRDPGWYQDIPELKQLLENDNLCIASIHVPELRGVDGANFGELAEGLWSSPIHSSWCYYRFHGTSDYSAGTYGYDLLKKLLSNKNGDCYIYFNNVDTYEIQGYQFFGPGSINYKFGAPMGHQIVPSAIYDCREVARICSEYRHEVRVGDILSEIDGDRVERDILKSDCQYIVYYHPTKLSSRIYKKHKSTRFIMVEDEDYIVIKDKFICILGDLTEGFKKILEIPNIRSVAVPYVIGIQGILSRFEDTQVKFVIYKEK